MGRRGSKLLFSVCHGMIPYAHNYVARWDLWQPGLGIFDITNPSAREWYAQKLTLLMDLGVDSFKVRPYHLRRLVPCNLHDMTTLRLISGNVFLTLM